MTAAAPVPTEIRLQENGRRLDVTFGPTLFRLPAEFLRVHSPSAEVQGHGPGERRLVAGRRSVSITGIDPVGNYAVRLRFDDGHSTGLYTWTELFKLGQSQPELWEEYLAALRQAGLSRD